MFIYYCIYLSLFMFTQCKLYMFILLCILIKEIKSVFGQLEKTEQNYQWENNQIHRGQFKRIQFFKMQACRDFMKMVPTATCALRDRQIISLERVYTPSTFYMKSAVFQPVQIKLQYYLMSILMLIITFAQKKSIQVLNENSVFLI